MLLSNCSSIAVYTVGLSLSAPLTVTVLLSTGRVLAVRMLLYCSRLGEALRYCCLLSLREGLADMLPSLLMVFVLLRLSTGERRACGAASSGLERAVLGLRSLSTRERRCCVRLRVADERLRLPARRPRRGRGDQPIPWPPVLRSSALARAAGCPWTLPRRCVRPPQRRNLVRIDRGAART